MPNFSRLSDAIATAAPANDPKQRSMEAEITQLLDDRPVPRQDSALVSKPLSAFGGGRDSQPAARGAGRASASDKPASLAKDTTLPFGRRSAEERPPSSDSTGSLGPSAGRTRSIDEAMSSALDATVPQRRKTPAIAKIDASETGPVQEVPIKSEPGSSSSAEQMAGSERSEASKSVATPKKSSLVASLEKARAEAASETRGEQADEPSASDAAAPAPEAVAAALFDNSGARLVKAGARSPGANSATISPFGSRPKVIEARSPQPETRRADIAGDGVPKETSKQPGMRAGDTSTSALDSGGSGDAALASSQIPEAKASARAVAKPGSAAPPSEALLDAVVDMVKSKPSSLSVFTSGSAFIHGVSGGEKPATSAGEPPHKLDTAAAELLRPMLRQWLAENMPRIVEEALRSELNSSQKTGEDTDKA